MTKTMSKPWERLVHRIATALAAISISLCAIAVILWPLSYATGVQLSVRNGAGTRYALLTVPSQFGLVTVTGEARAQATISGATQSFGSSNTLISGSHDMVHWFWEKPSTNSFWFGSGTGNAIVNFPEANASFKTTYKATYIPIWLVVLITFAGPMLWYRARLRRQYRIENDLCVYCGSDMSSSPYHCPSCGKEQQW